MNAAFFDTYEGKTIFLGIGEIVGIDTGDERYFVARLSNGETGLVKKQNCIVLTQTE